MTVPAWLHAAARRIGLWSLVALAFLTPFAVSLAANVTAGMRSDRQVLLAAGIAIPVMLMIAIELYLWVLDRHGNVPVIGKVAMAAPVVVAAGWSWLDTTGLLLAQYDNPWWLQRALCVAAPLATDGLAVLAVYVRRLVSEAARMTAVPVTIVEPPQMTEEAEPAEPWGGPNSVIDDDVTAGPAVTPTPLRPSPPNRPRNKRTRSDLVTAGKALTPAVTRKATETTDDFRRRVERAEREARRDATDRTEVPA